MTGGRQQRKIVSQKDSYRVELVFHDNAQVPREARRQQRRASASDADHKKRRLTSVHFGQEVIESTKSGSRTSPIRQPDGTIALDSVPLRPLFVDRRDWAEKSSLQRVNDAAFPRGGRRGSQDCRTLRTDPKYAIWELSGTTVLDTTSIANVSDNWGIELPLGQQKRLLFLAVVGIEPPRYRQLLSKRSKTC
jgi:hypothetical protein